MIEGQPQSFSLNSEAAADAAEYDRQLLVQEATRTTTAGRTIVGSGMVSVALGVGMIGATFLGAAGESTVGVANAQASGAECDPVKNPNLLKIEYVGRNLKVANQSDTCVVEFNYALYNIIPDPNSIYPQILRGSTAIKLTPHSQSLTTNINSDPCHRAQSDVFTGPVIGEVGKQVNSTPYDDQGRLITFRFFPAEKSGEECQPAKPTPTTGQDKTPTTAPTTPPSGENPKATATTESGGQNPPAIDTLVTIPPGGSRPKPSPTATSIPGNRQELCAGVDLPNGHIQVENDVEFVKLFPLSRFGFESWQGWDESTLQVALNSLTPEVRAQLIREYEERCALTPTPPARQQPSATATATIFVPPATSTPTPPPTPDRTPTPDATATPTLFPPFDQTPGPAPAQVP